MGGDAVARQPWEGHRVARGGIGGVDRREARGAMVRMVHAPVAMEQRLGIRGEHGVRAEGANLAHEVLAQDQVVGQGAIGHVQERHALVADHLGGGSLLSFTERRELERVGVRVLGAGVAAGAAHQPADRALVDP
jgi:hypothetical protein